MRRIESYPVAISRQDWSFRRVGPQNEELHKRKLKEAIKSDLPHIISNESIITVDPKSKKLVKVPLRSVELPRLKYKEGDEGVGTGDGSEKEGDLIEQGYKNGQQKGKSAGDQPGTEYYEAELTVDELQQMVFEDLGLPNLKPKMRQEIASDAIVFDDVRKRRSQNNLDIMRTVLANMQRNAQEEGKARIGRISPEDFRVRIWSEQRREEHAAVVFAMADISGSMGEFEKYMTKAFCWWTVGFLRYKYPKVDIVFIAHDTNAYQVTEEQFFTRGTGGGTKCSSANKLALELMADRYPPNMYNIYSLHFSDGENWKDDDDLCVSYVQEMLDMNINQYAFVQIGERGNSSLRAAYEQRIDDERMQIVNLNKKEDIYPGLKKIFPSDIS